MVLLDIVVLVILGYAFFRGFKSGLIMQVTTLVAIIAGIWGAIHFSDRMELWLSDQVDLGSLAGPISFFVTFMLILVLTNLVGKAVTKGIDIAMLSLPNKLAGGVISAAKYAIIMSAILQPLEGTGIFNMVVSEENKQESVLYEPIREIAPTIIPAIKESPWVKRTWDRVNEEVKVNPE